MWLEAETEDRIPALSFFSSGGEGKKGSHEFSLEKECIKIRVYFLRT